MTGLVGVFLGVLAGWKLADRFEVVMAVLVPFQLVLLIQSVGLALGKGVSPPDTVAQASYYIVQALILAFALGVALQLSALRFGRDREAGSRIGRSFGVALSGNLALVALTVAAFKLENPLLDPGSVARHSSSGPPIAGAAGIGLAVLLCAVLGCVTLSRRRISAARQPSVSG